MKRVIDYDPWSGITTSFDYDWTTDTTIIHREQDVSAILEMNKAQQNDEDYTKKGIKDGWWHYANIPNIVIEKWIREYGVNVYDKDHEPKVFKLLNQPEYRYLKTTTKLHTVR
jgi:hypothetical protein